MTSPQQRSVTADRVTAALCWLVAAVVTAAFGWMLLDVARIGIDQLSWAFLSEPPRDAGRGGGISSVLLSTGLVLLVCLLVALPLGVSCACWLAEFTRSEGRVSRLIKRSLDLLASVPSIIFGLFGMVFFCQLMQLGFSILAGGLTLACMVLPVVIQTTYHGFRSAPAELRAAAAALGLSRTTTILRLLLPAATHGITIGIVLGVGRALAETAALIFTSGYVTRTPTSLLDSGRTLSVHIYDLAMNVPGGEARAYSSALVLMAALLAVNLTASHLSRRWLPKSHDER